MQTGDDIRVVIVAEWLAAHGGAERVIKELASTFDSSRIVSVISEQGALPGAQASKVRTLVPGGNFWTGKRPLAALLNMAVWPLWGNFQRDADLVLSSHHLGGHWASISSELPHFSYVHTPARYAWYPELDNRASGLLGGYAAKMVRNLDLRAAAKVTSYAANSRTTQRRIRESWGRDARVIYPPVDVPRIREIPARGDKDYLIGVSRFIPYKRLDFVVELAEEAGLPAKIVGGGPMENRLRERARASRVPVEVLTGLDDEDVAGLLGGARALVYPAVEDFGIVPVEAMAAGTPVLALNMAGTAETVVDGATGRLLPDLDLRAWADAIMSPSEEVSRSCVERAEAFSPDRFRSQVRDWIGEARP